MRILHTEASLGWGGQEIRILSEAKGMRERGHDLFFATAKGARLAEEARAEGFPVYEIPLAWKEGLASLRSLIRIVRENKIQLINTHSSADAWLGGIAAKLTGITVLRTRHLSNPIKKGLNSLILYNWLADYTATTCEETADRIRRQAKVSPGRCLSVPTGVNPRLCVADPSERDRIRSQYGISPDELVVGTLCVLRSWKGIPDLLQAAKILQKEKIRWMIVGEGSEAPHFQRLCRQLGLEEKVIFTGYQKPPFGMLSAMDLFALLSTRSEGVSQSVLQAGFLEKPLITTTVGGLPEVCLDGETGFLVDRHSPVKVAEKVRTLKDNAELRKRMGSAARARVTENFLLEHTLDGMEAFYHKISL